MTIASNLGFPRIGARRELKFALERHWSGELDAAGLLAQAQALRAHHWRLQQSLGISHIPSNDFALYDHVLDTACMLGVIPEGYGWQGGPVSLATSFALARGARGTEAERAAGIAGRRPALEMTKWFDTNYHYLVPRVTAAQRFQLTENRPLAAFREAEALGLRTRPVLLGPVSFLLLCKADDGADPLGRLDQLLPLYAEILRQLAEAGAAWVQIDEPALALDLQPRSGPIAIMIEFIIREDDVPEFLALMTERGRIRRRDGARNWVIARDLEHPDVWLETYHTPTWLDYIRHNTRITQADAAITERIRELHVGPDQPRVRRWIERPTSTVTGVAKKRQEH